ncbi:hypothetical protein Pan153_09900 [Gimesia panareensis]|uniref:Uncharacterized protein n=1 Tax=Gimesia panareensis TaxID=2527978 RepID=A0A518FJ94_9PLAN|nr:hypothetical protein [Gimesia panareensis]QDV16363.1 hypothetical protein Pan153_09900 [Gimesia panareensis]
MQPRTIRCLFSLVCILQISSVAESQHSPVEPQWYHQLTPRLTRSHLHKIAGKPDSANATTDIYRLPEGELKLKFQDGTLQNCDLKAPSGEVDNFFCTWGGKLELEHLAARRKYLAARSFADLPQFSGPAFRSTYDGKCYQVDDGYLVILPILSLIGRSGHFKDKAAWVTHVHSDGTEEVLYRAFDHWQKLKPPQLSDAQVRQRMQKLHTLGLGLVGKPLYSMLGPPDASMGSGRCYRVYYLSNALVFIGIQIPSAAEQRKNSQRDFTDKYLRQTLKGESANQYVEKIGDIGFLRPGKEYISMIQWLRETQPADWQPPDKTNGQ